MVQRFILVGGGDFAVEIVAYLQDQMTYAGSADWQITDIVATAPGRAGDIAAMIGYAPVLRPNLTDLPDLQGAKLLVCMGDPVVRYRVMHEIAAAGGQLASVIHPSAYVAATATIGAGSIICPMAFIGPFARVGQNCAINVHAVVGHDVILGDCTVMSPGSDINGRGQTGEAAFLGAGAVISPKVQLAAFSKLSAGSVLAQSTEEGFLVHGNPANGRRMFRRPQTAADSEAK